MRSALLRRSAAPWLAVVLDALAALCLILVPAPLLTACRADAVRQAAPHAPMDHPDILRAIFHPLQIEKTPTPPEAIDLEIPLEDGPRLGCRLFSRDPSWPTILLFHGNGEIIPDYDAAGPQFLAEGLNFAVVDYRGYGWSEGEPLASRLLPDALAVLRFFHAWLAEHGHTGRLCVMGRSLGSACAIEAAARHPEIVAALIIESGFARTLPLARVLGVDLAALGIREEDTFANGTKIAAIARPTLILHGQYDQLIPLWQAEQLHVDSGAQLKELQIVPGADHNSVMLRGGPLYFATIRSFVGRATGASDWRQRRRALKAAREGAPTP